MIILTRLIMIMNKSKLISVICITLLFTILYTFCSDDEFNGIEKLSQHVKKLSNNDKISDEKYDKTIIKNIFEKFYFSLITMSTIGYGDIYPNSFKTRLLVTLQTFLLIIITFT